MPEIDPKDIFNRILLNNVSPTDWVNPKPVPRYNLVVIGGGTAGLVSAAGAAGLGAKVALVERHLLGGDCLNYGCIPSKAIIRSSRVAADIRDAGLFGLKVPEEVEIDFPAVMERMRRLRADISHHDSAARFRDLGVDVFLGEARFTGPDTVSVGATILRFKKAVIATGSRAVHPLLKDWLRPATSPMKQFSLTDRPSRLLVMGAGP
jgi:pyruvate/2-oxoglutarate dehydrogenase complex dihydrolipoamide dehydrogenase (E3) component